MCNKITFFVNIVYQIPVEDILGKENGNIVTNKLLCVNTWGYVQYLPDNIKFCLHMHIM